MAAYTFPVTLAESTSMVTGPLSLTARETGAVEAVRTQPLQSRNSPAHDSTQEFASHMRWLQFAAEVKDSLQISKGSRKLLFKDEQEMPSSDFLTHRIWKAPGFYAPLARDRRLQLWWCREWWRAFLMQSWLSQKDSFLSSLQSSWGSLMGKINNHWPFWIFSQCDPQFVTTESTQWACLAQQYGRAVRLNGRPTCYGPQKYF